VACGGNDGDGFRGNRTKNGNAQTGVLCMHADEKKEWTSARPVRWFLECFRGPLGTAGVVRSPVFVMMFCYKSEKGRVMAEVAVLRCAVGFMRQSFLSERVTCTALYAGHCRFGGRSSDACCMQGWWVHT